MPKQHNYYVYMMTNKNDTVIYTGVCNDLKRRVWEHKNKTNPRSFTAKYNANKLVYFECHSDIRSAIQREKQIKAASRAKKISLIEKVNKEWKDLSLDWGV